MPDYGADHPRVVSLTHFIDAVVGVLASEAITYQDEDDPLAADAYIRVATDLHSCLLPTHIVGTPHSMFAIDLIDKTLDVIGEVAGRIDVDASNTNMFLDGPPD